MERGTVVISTAGHDAGRLYVVLECNGTRLALADGKIKKIKNPKTKNVRHTENTGIKVDLSVYDPLLDAHIEKELKSLKKEGGCCLG